MLLWMNLNESHESDEVDDFDEDKEEVGDEVASTAIAFIYVAID